MRIHRKELNKPVCNLAFHDKTVLFEDSPVSDLFIENVGTDEHPCYHHTNDVTILFNQQRINKLSTNPSDAVNSWLSTLRQPTDALHELRGKCTDEQLLEVVKSRHIQTPSELIAWSNWLNANVDSVLAEIESSRHSSESDDTGGETEITE